MAKKLKLRTRSGPVELKPYAASLFTISSIAVM